MRWPALEAALKAWMNQVRCGLALWLWPTVNIAHGRQRLEHVARECGATWTLSKKIAARYFEDLAR